MKTSVYGNYDSSVATAQSEVEGSWQRPGPAEAAEAAGPLWFGFSGTGLVLVP